MLYEMSVADAYGIAFEFVPNTPDRPNDLSRYYQHPTYSDMVPGHYTDDTQRSIANALMILSGGHGNGALYNPIAYVDSYQRTFNRDPRPGYSKRFEAFLKDNAGVPAQEMALKLNRKGTNGAVMGSAVLGYLRTPEQVMLAAAAQAISTHSYTTIPFAQITALSAHYALYEIDELKYLNLWLYDRLHESGKTVKDFLLSASTDQPPQETITMGASSAVQHMLYSLTRFTTLSGLIRHTIDVGGDTDSAAAITVAVASASKEFTNDLPQPLIDSLENGNYGADYLKSLDVELTQYIKEA